MKLSGWIWLIVGIIITVVSGYVYLYIPKNGSPNTAMALFFFIGIIFIVIGIAKIFFRRMDDKSVMDSMTGESEQQSIMNVQTMQEQAIRDAGQNRVEQAINQMAQAQQSIQQPGQVTQAGITQSQETAPQHQAHRAHVNSYSQTHHYQGPSHTVQAPHANAGTATSSGTHHQAVQHTAMQHGASGHPVQNSEHGLRCKKCGNVNSGNANYCHQCGNRLK